MSLAATLNTAFAAIAKLIRDTGGRVSDAVIEMPESVWLDLKREAEQHSVIFAEEGRKVDTLYGMPVRIVAEKPPEPVLEAVDD